MRQKDIEKHFKITGDKCKVEFFTNGNKIMSKSFSSDHLAWCAGVNWKMLNSNNDYRIE
ncbi:hypothetical protein H8E88_16655 [candidate division KSB1 bacterium]|nr:hypothetical protein [candidate division KSB1 bacterium]